MTSILVRIDSFVELRQMALVRLIDFPLKLGRGGREGACALDGVHNVRASAGSSQPHIWCPPPSGPNLSLGGKGIAGRRLPLLNLHYRRRERRETDMMRG